jgi:hypothetical protein
MCPATLCGGKKNPSLILGVRLDLALGLRQRRVALHPPYDFERSPLGDILLEVTTSLSAAHDQTTAEFGNRLAFYRIEAVQ